MNVFLGALGTKLVDRWATLLIVPGLFYIATAAVGGYVLGQDHWHEPQLLGDRLDEVAASEISHSAGAIALVVTGVLVASATAGLLAEVSGRIAEWWWLGSWRGPLSEALARWRRLRWINAAGRYNAALISVARRRSPDGPRPDDAEEGPEPDTAALTAARDRIALAEPSRPTWMGDRMLAAAIRVRDTYDLDLVTAWPRLWLIVPAEVREQLALARGELAAAARLAGWGALYVVLAVWWWPAGVVGVAAIGAGWWQGRARTARLADLIESTVDLHGRDLAEHLGIRCPGRLTPAAGEAITRALRRNA